MKISKNGQYALLSVADLAFYGDAHQSIAQVAQRQNIDPRYLGQIFFALKNAGIITSVRGKGGGYLLARSADSISAGEVVRALEGDLMPTQCCVEDAGLMNCESFDACLTRSLWQAISHEINSTLDGISIADIVKLYKEGSGGNETE